MAMARRDARNSLTAESDESGGREVFVVVTVITSWDVLARELAVDR